jgi:CheY-like chemotaxis protein
VHDLPDGNRVLPLAVEMQPDVVVLDLSLAGVDGYCLAAQLRAHSLTATSPIVVLSAHAYPEDEHAPREAGPAAFLRKPCLPRELARHAPRVSENCSGPSPSRKRRPAGGAVAFSVLGQTRIGVSMRWSFVSWMKRPPMTARHHANRDRIDEAGVDRASPNVLPGPGRRS